MTTSSLYTCELASERRPKLAVMSRTRGAEVTKGETRAADGETLVSPPITSPPKQRRWQWEEKKIDATSRSF